MKKLFIVVAALAFVAVGTFAVAAEWNFYGSARMATFSVSTDKEYNGTAFDDKDTQWDLQNNSRIGAKVKAGDVGGAFELGFNGPSGANAVYTRILIGTWDFGAGTLLVGQTYTPTFVPISNQVYGGDADLFGWGGMGGSIRQPMIQVSFGGLKIALVRPNVVAMTGFATDTKMPKVEVSYAMKFGPAAFTFFGGYNSYDAVDAIDKGWSVDSNIYGLAVTFGTGPFYINGDVFKGSNLNYYGIGYPLGVSAFTAGPAWTDPENYDVDYMGYALVAGFKLNDMVTFEVGYGGISSEANATGTWEDDARSYYVNATINLAKGVMLIPEFGCIDRQDIKNGTTASTEQGKLTYFGAKWQINF